MREGIHPDLYPVIFVDGEHEFVTRSTMKSKKTREVDGVEHYVIPLEISSATHPFFTGKQKLIDSAGRVERFNRKYGLSAKRADITKEDEAEGAEAAEGAEGAEGAEAASE